LLLLLMLLLLLLLLQLFLLKTLKRAILVFCLILVEHVNTHSVAVRLLITIGNLALMKMTMWRRRMMIMMMMMVMVPLFVDQRVQRIATAYFQAYHLR
jgi:hypothetical protein